MLSSKASSQASSLRWSSSKQGKAPWCLLFRVSIHGWCFTEASFCPPLSPSAARRLLIELQCRYSACARTVRCVQIPLHNAQIPSGCFPFDLKKNIWNAIGGNVSVNLSVTPRPIPSYFQSCFVHWTQTWCCNQWPWGEHCLASVQMWKCVWAEQCSMSSGIRGAELQIAMRRWRRCWCRRKSWSIGKTVTM